MSQETKTLGLLGEQAVADFLEQQGCKILDRNFKTPFGEIDIIAKKGKIVSIVEVKTRAAGLGQDQVFSPEDNITPKKQRKLIKLGNFYMALHKEYASLPWEIDVAAVEISPESKSTIRFIRQAVIEE